ncbi:MAG: hypothetical protein RR060_01085, partial [Victivallaceae bacterium]
FAVLPEPAAESSGDKVADVALDEVEIVADGEADESVAAGPEVDFVDESAEYTDVNGDIDLSLLSGGELSEEGELNIMGNSSQAADLPSVAGDDVTSELVGARTNLMGDQAAMQQAKQNPLVARVIDLFAGEIVDIHG